MRPTREIATNNGQTYFVTSNTEERRPFFRHERWAKLFLETLYGYRPERFLLHAFVLMPDHFHLIITPSASLELAVQCIKGGFSFRLKSKMDVWMRSFNESQIMSEEKFVNCVRYIEENPVRRGLAATAREYAFSSASRGGLDPMPAHLVAGR